MESVLAGEQGSLRTVKLGKIKRKKLEEPEELRARIRAVHRAYFISRSEVRGETFIDDEAGIELDAVIEHISTRHLKHLGQAITISLLSARRYAPEDRDPTAFFGSISLRGTERSALAYLPPRPFWHMPACIDDGAGLVELTFSPMLRGFADLVSLNITERPTSVDGAEADK
jgi:hypothetical protein